MPRSDWGVVATLATCMILAAFGLWNQKNQTTDHGKSLQSQVSNSTNSIARTVDQDQGCLSYPENRQSELCAQWKAADAAENSAQYALLTMFVSAIGTILLVWTLAETRSNSRRELRAYVRLEPQPDSGMVKEGERFQLVLSQINYGHTPALNCEFQFSAGVRAVDWKWSGEVHSIRKRNKKITLHRDSPSNMSIYSEYPLTVHDIVGLESGTLMIVARGILFYDDVFGDAHYTQISIEIGQTELKHERIKVAAIGNIST